MDDQITPETLARMRAHPAFVPAVTALMRKMLALNAGDPLQDSIRKDLGRYVCGVVSLYLHATGGLTLPRLKQLCIESGLLSPGRARAFLLYLRMIGYVETAPSTGPGRAARYVPTRKMTAAFIDHLRIGFEAVALIEPDAAKVVGHLDDDAVFTAVIKQLGVGAINAARHNLRDPSVTFNTFVPRSGGMQVMYCLYEAALAHPDAPVELRVSQISVRARISRAQVLRLIRDAERKSLLRRDADGRIALAEIFLRETADLLAANLVARAVLALRGYEVLASAVSH